MNTLKQIAAGYNRISLIGRIAAGIVIGVILALVIPQAEWIGIFGDMFVGALKAIAPVLVAILVMSALCQGKGKLDRRFGLVIFYYLLSTFLAAAVAVAASFLFPQTLVLAKDVGEQAAPGGLQEVLGRLLMNIIDNPINAIANANYMGILFWAAVLGLALKRGAGEGTKTFLADMADAVSQAVRWVINLAPFGICGLVFRTVSGNGLDVFTSYGKLVAVLVGSMLLVALVIDPLIIAVSLHTNPYPLVFKCIRESGLTAFFTRSSAANIPVNMSLCERLGLDREFYSVSIPLGATINMDGTCIFLTITGLFLARAYGVAVPGAAIVSLAITIILLSLGCPGVPGAAAVCLGIVLADLGVPIEASGLVMGVIPFLDMVITMSNTTGDVAASLIVARSEGLVDLEIFNEK